MKRHFLDFIGMVIPGQAGEDFVRLVCEHPAVCVPPHPTHYFSSDALSLGRDWYEQQFVGYAAGQKRGEFSTTYLQTPGAGARIAREYPDARLVIVLANPIEVVAALYTEAVAMTVPRTALPSLESFLEGQPRPLEQCRFGRQVQSFATYYSPIDFFVCTLDDVRAAPVAVLASVYEHLKIDRTFVPKILQATVGDEDIARPSRLSRLLRLDKVKAKRRAAKQLLAATLFPYPSVDISAREYELLARYFAPDVEQLGQLLHRDLRTEWKYPIATPAPKRRR